VNRADVGVIPCGRHLHFAQKTVFGLAVVERKYNEEFERNLAVEQLVSAAL
jgi:hypothetical protein